MKNILRTFLLLLVFFSSFKSYSQYTTLNYNSDQNYFSSVNAGSSQVVIYSNYIYSYSSPSTLTTLAFNMTGSSTASDVTTYTLYASTNSYLDYEATSIGTTSGINLNTLTGSVISFTGLNFAMSNYYSDYKVHYFFLTASVSSTATLNSTFQVNGASYSVLTITSYNYSNTSAGTKHTVTSVTGYISNIGTGTNNLTQGQTDEQVVSFYAYMNGGSAYLKSITLPISGTFSGTDFDNLKLYYYNFSDYRTILIGSIAGASLSGPSIKFTASVPVPLITNGGYFYLYASVSDNAQSGDVLNIISLAGSNLEVENLTLTGSTSNLTSINISSSQISIQDVFLPDEDVSPSSSDNIVYETKIYPDTYGAIFNHATFTTTGTFTSNDVSAFTLWANTSATFNNNSYYKIATITATGSGQILDFTNFRKYLDAGNNWYIYLTVDLKQGAIANKTISISQPDVINSFGFLTGTVTGTTTTTGIKTIKVPDISISQSNLADAKIGIGTSNNLLYKIKVSATIANAYLNKAVFNMGGDFTSTDAYYYQLSYNSTNDFASASQISTGYYYNGANSSITFSGFNILIPANADTYLFLSVNSNNGGSSGKTIKVLQGVLSDLGFASGTKSGTIGSGSTFTFDNPTVSASSVALAPGTLGTSTSSNPIYKIELNVSNAPGILQTLNVTTSGTYIANDLEYYYAFRLIYSNNDVFGDSDDHVIAYRYGSASTGSGENFSFNPGMNIPVGKSYLFIVTDIANATTSGHTINIKSANAGTALSFLNTTITGTLDQGATFTIKKPNPIFTTLPLNNSLVLAPTNDQRLIYSLEVDNEVPCYLNNIDFTFGGTFNTSDVYYYYAYKTNSPVFNPNVYFGSEYMYSSSGSGDVFSAELGSFPAGKTYIHILAYIRSSATNGNTISVETVSGIDVDNGTSVSNIAAGNTYSILRVATIEPFNIQPFTASSGTDNFLYGFKVNANYSYPTFNQLVLSVSGTLDPALISNYYLYYSETNDPSSAYFLSSGTYSTVSGQNVTFSASLGLYDSPSTPYYFFVRAFIANTSITGSSIKMEPTGLDGFSFSNTSVLGLYSLGQSHILTTPSVSATTYAIPSETLNPDGSTDYPIYRIEYNTNSAFNIVSLPISISGTYDMSQIDRFSIYKDTKDVFDVNSSIYVDDFYSSKVSSASGESFNLSLSDNLFAKTYYYVVVRFNSVTTTGTTIQVNSLSVSGIQLANGSISGTSMNGNVFTVKNSSVALSNVNVPSTNLSNYNFDEIYTIKAVVTDADVKINNLTFLTNGTYSVSDVQYMYFYISKSPKYSPVDMEINDIYLSGLNTETTISLNNNLTIGDNYIHFVTYTVGATPGKTIGINAVTLTSGNFAGIINVSGSLSGGNLFTTSGNYLGTYVSNTIAVPGGKINKGSSKVIYEEKITVSNASVYLYYLDSQIGGSFNGSDVDKFRLWYSKNPTFDSSAVSLSGSNITYPYDYIYLYLENSLAIGDHYFYVTADISPNATTGSTFYVVSQSGSNLYVPYSLSGTGVAMRGSDFVIGIPSNNNDITTFSLPNQIGQATISGTNIFVNLPLGTDLTNLIATFTIDADANAFVGTTKQVSGTNTNNFTSPVTYKIVSETGNSKNYIVTVSLIQTITATTTGITELTYGSDFTVYPNPASGYIVVKSNGSTSLELFDVIGNKILQTVFNSQTTLDISNLTDGVYFAKVIGKNGTAVKKVVVSR